MRRYLGILVLLLVSVSEEAQTKAHAGSASVSIVFSGPPNTLTPAGCPVNYVTGQLSFPVPAAAGMLVFTCTITPANWTGMVTMTGADAGLFTMSQPTPTTVAVHVGPTPITVARTYNVMITPTP